MAMFAGAPTSSPLEELAARLGLSHKEFTDIRIAAWRELGVLVVAPNWYLGDEKPSLIRLGNRIYGPSSAEGVEITP